MRLLAAGLIDTVERREDAPEAARLLALLHVKYERVPGVPVERGFFSCPLTPYGYQSRNIDSTI